MGAVARVFVALFCSSAHSTCPEPYKAHEGGCYVLSENKGSMTQCQDTICSELKGTLATAPNQSVASFLMKLVNEKNRTAFIGLFERGANESGDWVWTDGTELNQTTGNYKPLPLGWGFGEPNNWCLDEDCAALGIEYLSNYSRGGVFFGGFLADAFLNLKKDGWFDLACSTQLHCLCQTGVLVSEDFLQWEFNYSTANSYSARAEDSLDFNRSYWGNYDTCFAKRTRCWWFDNSSFQASFWGVAFICAALLVYSLMGLVGLPADTAARDIGALGDEIGPLSSYGKLLDAFDRMDEVDNTVNRWIIRGSWATMMHGIILFTLAFTMLLHVNFGVSFGFAIDGLQAGVMGASQVIVAISACQVQRHLSTSSRIVVAWWILVLALSKLAMSVLDLVLTAMYFSEALGGFVKENSSYCTAGYTFSWMLLLSMAFHCTAGLALSRIYSRTVVHMGGISTTTRIIGCAGLLLILTTLGAGLGLGYCSAQFIFDDPFDAVDPLKGIAVAYAAAALCQFTAGASMLRANTQARAYFSKDASGSRSVTELSHF